MMNVNRLFAVCVAVLLVILWIPLTAVSAPRSYRIELPTRTITPPADNGVYLAQRGAGEAADVLLQFYDHPGQTVKHALSLAGVQLQEYVGGGAWVAYLSPDVNPAAFQGINLRWAGPMISEDKVDLRVAAGEIPSWATTPDGNLYAVTFMKNVAEDEAEIILRDAGATPGALIEIMNTWYALGDPVLPQRLAGIPEVHYITSISPPLKEINAGVRAAMHVDDVYNPPYNLTGAGETVCVYDAGIVYNHLDFENRLTVGEPGATLDHSTHVAGTVGGNGAPAYRGMAPGVQLISFFYEACVPYCLYDSPQDIYENYEAANLDGAHIMTNSIGSNTAANGYDCAWEGDYEITSALADSLVRGALGDPLIVTWAAGNERGYGTCGTQYYTLGVPGSAKNTIVVGATNDNSNMTSFSSWGPTDDGRIKPDVSAPGEDVVSCNNGGGYVTMSGTSMATPAVAGVSALLLQAWHQTVNPGTFPLPETVKALLCNSAEERGNAGPDYQYGWGRVDARRAVDTIFGFGVVEGTIEDDEVFTYDFSVPEGIPQLKLTLAWSDAPGGYLPQFVLVNDLDFKLTDPDGTDHMPFILDPDNPGQVATTGINTLDNVEQVLVNSPMVGDWTFTITGADVPSGPQTWGIAGNVPMVAGVTAISGTVTDAGTGDPLADANIRIAFQTGDVYLTSGVDGTFLCFQIFDGDVPVEVTHVGYVPQHAWVIDDGSGSAVLDIAMTVGNTGSVTGDVYSEFGVPIPGAHVIIQEIPAISDNTDNNGEFELTGVPALTPLTVYVDYSGLIDSAPVFLQPDETVEVHLIVGTSASEDPVGPDAYGYIAVQENDDNPFAPVFDWVEIDPLAGGDGVRVNTPAEETATVVALPFSFPYYDSTYSVITVCENGFFSFGNRLGDPLPADYSNSVIPDPDGTPAMIAPFWDDFYALETNLSYYDDAANGRFIIEWYNSRQYVPETAYETFEVILFDPDFYPENGEWGHILYQYDEVMEIEEGSTVGIEDETETIGLQVGYFDANGGSWDANASPIVSESAVYIFRPSATVNGTVAVDPPNPEILVTITLGNLTMDALGNYSFDNAVPGFSVMSFSAPGHETALIGIEVPQSGVVDAPPITLTRLDVPTEVYYEELNGNFENGAMVYWMPPDPGQEIDEFLGRYRVYRNGQMVGETDELDYGDGTPFTPGTMYWVTAMYAGGESDSSMHAIYETGVAEHASALPIEYDVAPPWPNPFNPSTAIQVALPEPNELTVAVYDLLGREVARLASHEMRRAGYHRLVWNAFGHASGIYFVRVEAGPYSAVRKVMLLK